MSSFKAEEIYADFLPDLDIHPVRKDLLKRTNEDAIKGSIRNILMTNFYERPFRPDFGANLRRYLFENITPVVLDSMKSEIILALEKWEPRAEIISVTVSALEDENSVNVSLIFTPKNVYEEIPLNVTIPLDRVR